VSIRLISLELNLARPSCCAISAVESTRGCWSSLGLLGRIGEVAGEIPGGGGEFHLVVLQDTDCGITRLAGDPAKLAHYFQIQEGELKTKAVTDPRAAVTVDVAALRAILALPGAWLISGLVYDVATRLAEIVVPPAPIPTAQNSFHEKAGRCQE
jgi:carbonic anhydrase